MRSRTRWAWTVVAAVLVVVAVAGCGSSPTQYRILMTEPSGNLQSTGRLILHWSCDPSVDPATRFYPGRAQEGLWTTVEGRPGAAVLDAAATCPPGSLLTVQMDGQVVEWDRLTELRCQVSNGDGVPVADETKVRREDTVCRVPVPE